MPTVPETAEMLAGLLMGGATELSDPAGSDLEFFPSIAPDRLDRLAPPPDCWAVDGGQALVADARCLQVAVTRAARTRWQDGRCTLEEQDEFTTHVLRGPDGGPEARRSLASMGAPVAPQAPVDINVLRDWSEWRLVSRSVDQAARGAIVLVDGDLQPDWRIPAHWLAELLVRAGKRGVLLAGVTKHSSLARGGAPLVGQLELEAERLLGPRTCWWAPVAQRRSEVGPGLLVVIARLDPDARFAFRVDLPADGDAASVLGQLSALADDAAFPGYPYPLSTADRLAACPNWARAEIWAELESELDRAGLPQDVKERAFDDRHSLMERA
ncbi:MAG TPA: DNA double-strand break repair nuclease NurA [Acidimicrobiales bacterium]|nr:DNA double-strand break repair nuclease NurA [Acidimicrobiales bacterium]